MVINSNNIEQKFHMMILTWKAQLQEVETWLEGVPMNRFQTRSHCNKEKVAEVAVEAIQHVIDHLQKIKRLKRRISQFENRCSLFRQDMIPQRNIALDDEADDISSSVGNCYQRVKNYLRKDPSKQGISSIK